METLCFSIYSDISILMSASSVPNTASVSALESSVLPTPVGPRKRKLPMGLLGLRMPALPRFIAFATASTASCCETMRSCRVLSRKRMRMASFSVSFLTGIFVHELIVSAMVSSVTVGLCSSFFCSHFEIRFCRCFSHLDCSADSFFALNKSSSIIACSFASSSSLSLSLECLMDAGSMMPFSLSLEADSSIRSMALSGSILSLI